MTLLNSVIKMWTQFPFLTTIDITQKDIPLGKILLLVLDDYTVTRFDECTGKNPSHLLFFNFHMVKVLNVNLYLFYNTLYTMSNQSLVLSMYWPVSFSSKGGVLSMYINKKTCMRKL